MAGGSILRLRIGGWANHRERGYGEPLAVEIGKMAGRDAVVVEIALSPG